MHRHIDSWHSPRLNKQMEIVTYGHFGFPLLLFPTAAADYLEYERFQMLDVVEDSVNAGKVKIFSINSINRESWMNDRIHPRDRAIRQQVYNAYIADEVVPYIWNSCGGRIGVITCGASLGAYHAANQLFRRPDLFAGMIAMSGNYNVRNFTDGYYDDNVYYNDPLAYLPNLSGEYLTMLQNKAHIHILSGQGSYERPEGSREISDMLNAKGIPNEFDLWGYDMPHDWPTWRAMLKYYLAAKF